MKKPIRNKVSQSLLKNLLDYEAGDLCGGVLQAKLDGTYPDDTDSGEVGKPSAARQGQYFEFITFGNLPAHGDGVTPPRAEYTAAGLKRLTAEQLKAPWEWLKIDDMYAPYAHAHRKSEKLKRYMAAMKMKIISKGENFTNEWGQGTTDIIVECKLLGGRTVIDVKYTGLLDATWSKSKFAWNLDNELLNEIQGIQPKQYKWLTGLDFHYLLVSSSAKIDDMRFIKANVSDSAMMAFREQAMIVRDEKLPLYEATGFEARPSLVKCDACPLRNDCKDRAKYPAIVPVDFN